MTPIDLETHRRAREAQQAAQREAQTRAEARRRLLAMAERDDGSDVGEVRP